MGKFSGISGFLAKKAGLPSLIRWSGQKIFLPFYHAVSDEAPPHLRHLYPLRNVSTFKADLEFFLKNFRPLSLYDLHEISCGRTKPDKPSFFLSFDDGLREIYDTVAPLLMEKGIHAAFFINPSFVDKQDLFFRYKASLLVERLGKIPASSAVHSLLEKTFRQEGIPFSGSRSFLTVSYQQRHILDKAAGIMEVSFETYLQEQKPYMSLAQLQELEHKGFSIGAHSMDHPLYKDIPLNEQIRQTRESLDYIRQHFNPAHACFAFPFTDHGVGKAFFDDILGGPEPAAALTFGTAGLKKDISPRHWQRYPMEGTQLPAEDLVKQEYAYYLMKAPLGKNKISRS